MSEEPEFLSPEASCRWLSRIIWFHLVCAAALELMILASISEVMLPRWMLPLLYGVIFAQFGCPLGVCTVTLLAFFPPLKPLARAVIAELLIFSPFVVAPMIPESWLL